MRYQKDGRVLTESQVRAENNTTAFCKGFDFTQLGYSHYAEPEHRPTLAEIKLSLANAVQAKLDSTAQHHRYDNILSARTAGLGSTNPKFQAEGAAFSKWWSDVWTYVDQVEQDVLAGTRGLPTPEQLVEELPQFTIEY
jgi:hypothetical protein